MNSSLLGKASLVVSMCLAAWTSVAQHSVAAPAPVATSSAVPRLVNFNGVLTGANDRPSSGVTGVTFLLFQESQGGAPLWMETQNVTPDKNGHYAVTLGATKA